MPRQRAAQAAVVGGAAEYPFSDKYAQRAPQLDLLGIAHNAIAYPIPHLRLGRAVCAAGRLEAATSTS